MAATIANTTAETFINALMDRQLAQLTQFQEVLAQYDIKQDPTIMAQQAGRLGGISVVEPALPPGSPTNKSSAKALINTTVAVSLGLFVSSLVVILREYLDDRFKSLPELRTAAGLPPLASVPWDRNRNGLRIDSSSFNHRSDSFTEAYHFLLNALEFALGDKKEKRAIMVTSAGVSEGKTTSATNLALAGARRGKSVILVDSDLRSSSLEQVFNLGEHKGLTQLLTGNSTLDEALADTPVKGLQVIPSGPPHPEPDVLLSSSKMEETVKELKERADLVIFDSASLLAVTDSLHLATLVDGVLLVADEGQSTRKSVVQAADRLRQVNAPILGATLNKSSGVQEDSRILRYYRKFWKKSLRKRGNLG